MSEYSMSGPVHAECEVEIKRLKRTIEAIRNLNPRLVFDVEGHLDDLCPVTLIVIGVKGRTTTPCAFAANHRGRHSFEGATCP